MEHGGDIYTEGKFKGVELIDFSSNINFLGVPESFKKNIGTALENIICYPDLKYRETKLHIKKYLKQEINEENIILGNGAAEIINLAISTLKRPCIVIPSFAEYENTAKKFSERIVYSKLKEDFSYDYRDILEKLKESDGLIIANPNNPNGGILDKVVFQEIIDYCEEHEKKIIIDEAFVEFIKDDKQSFIDKCSSFKCLFIIRALTKFFAMPGIRFGYGICSDIEFIRKLSKLQLPWNINNFAEFAVKSVLEEEEYIKASKTMILKEREYFTKKLNKFKFIERIYESHANFLLLKLNKISGEELFTYALSNKILIRRCRNFTGLDDSFIRIAVKNREANIELLKIFMKFELEKGIEL
ncbi:aminotransferase class I/II-fold pyridoxal phosphate-dependent enzyme [Clostridium sp. 19966]|nr:aminotransferase class I/II-fold pyridoxal phosphate-dependent enzyme [Clostridium sp. 19966]